MPETATLEPTESAQATPSESFFSELNRDDTPTADGSSPEPAAPTVAEPESQAPAAEPAAPGAEVTAPAGTPAAAPPVEPKIKIRGKEYTAAELAAKPDLLQDLAQTYEQFPHLQQKYVQTLEQARQVGQPQAQGQQPPAQGQAQQPTLTPQMLRATYDPQMADLVQAGFLEGDLVELYPDAMANILLMRDLVMDTRAAVANLLGQQAQAEGASRSAQVNQRIVQGFDSLASQGGPFEPLKDDKVRGEFYKYLYELNPQEAQLTPDFIGRQFVAFNHNVYVEAARQLEAQKKADADRAKRNAGGPGGNARPIRSDQPATHFDWLNDRSDETR